MRRVTPALLLSVLLAGPAVGQEPALDRIEALLITGDYAGARAALERWWSEAGGRDASEAARVRATMLRARMAPDPGAAEKDYLAIALGHPTSPYAPQALLYLGQGLLATGDAARAAAYLRRLVDDYPGNPARSIGLLWLARAHRLDGAAGAACAIARQALRASDADLAALLRHEEEAACTSAGPHPAGTAARTAPADAPPAAPPPPAAGRFTVQSGAFRQVRGAEALAADLRRAGFDARLAHVPASPLLRVRVGRFLDAASARALAARIRAAGFEAMVVADADRERPNR